MMIFGFIKICYALQFMIVLMFVFIYFKDKNYDTFSSFNIYDFLFFYCPVYYIFVVALEERATRKM